MHAPLSAAALSRLIGGIYDCVLAPGQWPAVLEQLRQELSFANASLSAIRLPAGPMLLNVLTGPSADWIARGAAYGPEVVEQWGGAERMSAFPLGEPLVLSRIRPRAEWADNRFFREWARPQGIHDTLAVALTRDGAMVSSLGMGRHDDAGEIGEREMDAVRLLSPHVRRAVTISNLLDVKTLAADTFRATLDGLKGGVVLADERLHVLHANAVGQALLDSGDPLGERNGALTTRQQPVLSALRRAFDLALGDEAGLGRRGCGIPAPTRTGSPCVLHVLPLAGGKLRPGLMHNAVAAIFVSHSQAATVVPAGAIAELFDLTPAEERVFSLIAAGRTTGLVADSMGIGGATV
jgi:hypothetical protein